MCSLPVSHSLSSMVRRLGEPGFAQGLLQDLEPVLPAASWSVYRTGHRCKPTLFMSASQGVPDTTQDCWWAYLAGPYRSDRTWGRMFDDIHVIVPETRLCHVTAKEVDGEHRARVYEAHGMAERVSVVEYESTGSVFAVNFYRHQHQLPFSDRQIGEFESVAPVLLELARKHILLSRPGAHGPGTAGLASTVLSAPAPAPHYGPPATLADLRARLLRTQADLTDRELDVCGCFSSPPSSWEKALAAERDEAHKLRKLVSRILPLEEWEQGFELMRQGQVIKILIDMEA